MVKKATKKIKRKSKSLKSDHAVLGEALTDISRELSKLKRDKESLSKKMDASDQEIINVQNYEARLRDRISKLVAKESQLNKSKGASQEKLLKIKEKISKIKKIQEELRDI